MKKIFGLLSALALIMVMGSCGDDNNGSTTGSVTRTIKALNHIVSTASDGESPHVSSSNIDYTFDRANQSVTALTLRVKLNGNEETTVNISGVQSSTSGGVCSFKASGNGVTDLRGRLDLNEGTLRVNYNLDGKYRVIATTPEVFSNNCPTACEYSDGSTSNNANTVYQFNISADNLTAKLIIGSLIDTKANRTLDNIVAQTTATVKVTKAGYEIVANDMIPTKTYYKLNGKTTETTTYPISDLKATIDLENSKFDATLLLGNITLTANGSVSN